MVELRHTVDSHLSLWTVICHKLSRQLPVSVNTQPRWDHHKELTAAAAAVCWWFS